MDRRALLLSGAMLAFGAAAPGLAAVPAGRGFRRVRPIDRDWPDARAWARFGQGLEGQLIKLSSPFDACRRDPTGAACVELFRNLKNPYFIGDDPALTQTLGWVDAWTSAPSAYAVAAKSTADVVAAVNFARERRLRLVIKGGGHSYQGTSNAPDSLLIWTHGLRTIESHDAFMPKGCESKLLAQPAVSVGAGCRWIEAYNAVTTKGGRYVQGGGCTTVGVAGLVSSGGFGSFSKAYGTAAGGLLEAEVVTADGQVRIANACTNPDLFWAIKGGGGGGFGVVTRLTLRTHALPKFFGAAQADIKAKSPAAYRRLVADILAFYRDQLMNPHWGEQIGFRRGERIEVRMVFQGLEQAEAAAVWKPFLDKLKAASDDYIVSNTMILALPAARFWDAEFMRKLPGIVKTDTRPGAPVENVFWAGDEGQVGQVLHGYQSTWLSQDLLQADRIGALADAVAQATQSWGVSLHFNKGLAGAPRYPLETARDTATNPAVLDAFALAILGASEQPAYPGVAGHEPKAAQAREDAKALNAAFAPLRSLQAKPAAYVSESDYFQTDWGEAFWGANLPALIKAKETYDPDGLFFTHHGVGSDRWSADGFERLS
jgi:FAD/FMN-containing dehydrogenase